MTRIFVATVLLFSLIACADVQINSEHPSVQKKSANNGAIVYFIRPMARYSGAVDRALEIALNDTPLLRLDKGTYTLLSIAPGSKKITLKSYTSQGTEKKIIAVSQSKSFNFIEGKTLYLLLKPYPRGFRMGTSFQPTQIDHAVALRVAGPLKALGAARSRPLRIE